MLLEAMFNDVNRQRLDDCHKFLATIAMAAKRPLWKPGRGQPRNISAYLVMKDLAAIFEYLTRTEATRQVDRKTHDESGPFRDFAGAVWPFVFDGDYGFSAAIKNWAAARKYREGTAVICQHCYEASRMGDIWLTLA
jgi:hypothetical protein